METQAYDPAQLLEHLDWLRALARQLVGDATLAEDVAQETWRQAHERPPRDARNLRGWLAAVARHVAINARRADARRETHEQRAARHDVERSSAELVAQAELQRELVGHVLELDEPYRSVVVLRYFRGLSAAQIASARGVPQASVRTQLARALERLRERLDRTRGGREAWMQALAPIAGAGSGAALKGASSAVFVALAAVTVLIAGAWIAVELSRDVDPGRHEPLVAVEAAGAADPSVPNATVGRGTAAELASAHGERVTATASAAPPARGTLHLRVVDARTREPVAYLEYAVFAERGGNQLYASGRTDGDGRATCSELPENTLLVQTEWRAPWAPGFGALWLSKGATSTLEIALEPGATAVGRVVDDTGAPFAGAEIGLGTQAAAYRSVGVQRGWVVVARSGDDGRFRVGGLRELPVGVWIIDGKPRPERTMLMELAAGDPRLSFFGATTRRVDVSERAATDSAEIELGDLVLPRAATIAGRVVDVQGKPIARALVSSTGVFSLPSPPRFGTNPGADPVLRTGEVLSGADGRFEVAAPANSSGLLIVWTPDGAQGFERVPELQPGELRRDVVITIERERMLTVRLLDASGARFDETLANPAGARIVSERGLLSAVSVGRVALRARFVDGAAADMMLVRDSESRVTWMLERPRVELRALDVHVIGYRDERVELRDPPARIDVRLQRLPRVRVTARWSDAGARADAVQLRGLTFHACQLARTDEKLSSATSGILRNFPGSLTCCGLGSALWVPVQAATNMLELPVEVDEPFYVHVTGDAPYHTLGVQTFGPFAPHVPGSADPASADAHELVLEPRFEATGEEEPHEPPDATATETERAHVRYSAADRETGEALDAHLSLSDARSPQPFYIGFDRDADGATLAPPGRYDVHVGASGYRSQTLAQLELRPGAKVDLGRIVLDPLAQRRLRFVDAVGAPWGPPYTRASLGGLVALLDSGRARFRAEPDVLASARVLTLVGKSSTEPDAAYAAWTFDVPAEGADGELVLRVLPPREVRVRVRGIPAAHARCSLRIGMRAAACTKGAGTLVGGNELESSGAAERVFTLHAGPGRYVVRATCPLHPIDDQDLEVVAGDGPQELVLLAR